MHKCLITPHIIRFVFLCAVSMTFNLSIQSSVLAGEAGEKDAPVNTVEISQTPGVPIKGEKKNNESWLSRHKWWVAIGAVLLGGGVAAAALSKGGGGEEDDPNGSYRFDWQE